MSGGDWIPTVPCVHLDEFYILVPDPHPTAADLEANHGWAFCVGIDGVDIAGDGIERRLTPADSRRRSRVAGRSPSFGTPASSHDRRTSSGNLLQRAGGDGELVLESDATRERLQLSCAVRLMTCFLDTKMDGVIDLHPTKGHHFLLDPVTPLRFDSLKTARPPASIVTTSLEINRAAPPLVSRTRARSWSTTTQRWEHALDADDDVRSTNASTAGGRSTSTARCARLDSPRHARARRRFGRPLWRGARRLLAGQLARRLARACARRCAGAAARRPAGAVAGGRARVGGGHRCTLRLTQLQLACHGEVFSTDKPMLQLNVHKLKCRSEMVHVGCKVVEAADEPTTATGEQPPAVGQAMISWMPPKADALHLRSELKIDGRYLNMDVNEMEPLAEVWHAALAVSKEAGGWMSVRLHSADLLQLNLTYELQRTLEQLRNAAQAGDAAGLAKRKTGDGELTECKVRDCASGDSGCKTLAEHIGAPDRSNEPPPSPAQGFGRGGTRYVLYVPTASLLQMSRTKSTVISVRLVEERRPRERQYFNLDAFRDGTNAHAHDAVPAEDAARVGAAASAHPLAMPAVGAPHVAARDSNLPHAVLMTDVKPNDEAGRR